MSKTKGSTAPPDDLRDYPPSGHSCRLWKVSGKTLSAIGTIDPTPGIVDQYYNTSTGTGDNGEIDTKGPWNENIEVVESPAIQEFQVLKATPKQGKTTFDTGEGNPDKTPSNEKKPKKKSNPH